MATGPQAKGGGGGCKGVGYKHCFSRETVVSRESKSIYARSFLISGKQFAWISGCLSVRVLNTLNMATLERI